MANKKSSDILVAETLRIFWRAVLRHKRDLWLSLLTTVGAVLISVAVPFFAGRVFAGVAHHSTELNKYLILLAIASFGGFLGNRYGISAFNRMLARTMAD